MLNEVSCPKCQAKLRSNNDLTGKTVRCSKCQERFRASPNNAPVGASLGDSQTLSAVEIAALKPMAKPVRSALEAIDDLPVLDAMPAVKTVVKPVAISIPAPAASSANAFAFDEAPEPPRKKRARAEEDEEEETSAPKKKKKSRDDEEEQETVVDEIASPTATDAFSFDEAPTPSNKKSKRRIEDDEDDEDDDDEEDAKPKRGRPKVAKKGPSVLLLAGIAIGFLVLAGGGVAAYLMLGKKDVAKAPTSAAKSVAAPEPDTKATKPDTKATGTEPITKPTGKGKPPPKGGPKTPPAAPKSNIPKAPAAETKLASVTKDKFTIDTSPDSIKAFRIVGDGPDRKIFIARNSFAGFQGQGAIDTIDRYAIDSGAKTGSCDVKSDGVKWPRPIEASPDGKHLIVEGPAGKLSLYSFEEKKFLIEGADPFAGQANRKGPLKGLNWMGNDTFLVSDANGSTDEWSVADKKVKKAGPKLPDAEADAKIVVHPLDDKGEVLAVLRDSQFFLIQKGKAQGPGSLPEASAVPIALAGSTLADRVKMAVVAQIKDTTQHMVYILNFSDKDKGPIAIRLPDGIGTVTDIGWQSVDSLIVTIEGGAAALLIDLEEEFPVGYIKSPSAKAHVFGKATFNSLWYAVADATGKTQLSGVNLDFDGYKKMAEDAKASKIPVYIVPDEKGISK